MEGKTGQKRVVVAGHISLDITPVFLNGEKQKIYELLRPGKLLRVGEARLGPGGAVSNTGLALHRLGTEVTLMSKTGDDYFGRLLREMVGSRGCRTWIQKAQGESTPYTIVIAPRGMDRIFLHDTGCNDTFSREDVDLDQVRDGDHFHFGYPTLMRRFYMDEGKELAGLFQSVKNLGVTTSLDLTAVDPESEAAGCDWIRILSGVLPYVDFFVPSVEELGFMLDRSLYEVWQERASGEDITAVLSLRDVDRLAVLALKLGAKVVLLKCGAAGMYLKTAQEVILKKALPGFIGWGGISRFEDSFVPDRLVSAAGAGDTSIAAFIKAMLEGFSPGECVRYAAATGASCVTAYDSISGLLDFKELKRKMDEGWKKQKLIHP